MIRNSLVSMPLVAVALVLTGCVSTNTNYQPLMIDISEPPLGQVVTAEVGSAMLNQGKFVETDAIYLGERVGVGLFNAYTFSPGYYIKEGEDKKNEFYRPELSAEGGRVDKAALADPYKTMLLPRGKNTVCAVTVFNVKVCKNDVDVRRLRRPALIADGFQQTLIYSGRIGNKINIAYREFSNNTARPAFNNDVEYDLSESMVIGYKGAEIEIVEATNRMIKYKVVRNFNAAVR
jgi:hypothetical protein